MAGNEVTSLEHNHPLFLQATDAPGLVLVLIELTGSENYALWSGEMKLALMGKGKIGFVDGTCVKSSYRGELIAQWEKCDAIVLSWIGSTISSELMPSSLPQEFYSQGESKSSYDHSLFTKRDKTDIVIVLVYVDDLLISGSNNSLMHEAKETLHSNFKMKDLGELRYFLGIEVMRSNKGILHNQRKYALQLISEARLSACKPVSTPMEQNHKLTTVEYDKHVGNVDDAELQEAGSYQKLIGKLFDLTITRLDISFAVQVLSQFMQHPNESQMEAALRVIKYVKGSPSLGLLSK
ncbi:PREDICTED: uncharacterized protein LOC109231425 [Nicotiana attenuata]|uniref:uncharacterized protein LOC109231425 n=1 Tax=Nicotiana attenuata TaxID=49451 RepID=UPI000905B83F|nr:PREDICTED: uncharacterized protein LOC109231425 [Nicotiana attenuata]